MLLGIQITFPQSVSENQGFTVFRFGNFKNHSTGTRSFQICFGKNNIAVINASTANKSMPQPMKRNILAVCIAGP
jgi:hypothetical protein